MVANGSPLTVGDERRRDVRDAAPVVEHAPGLALVDLVADDDVSRALLFRSRSSGSSVGVDYQRRQRPAPERSFGPADFPLVSRAPEYSRSSGHTLFRLWPLYGEMGLFEKAGRQFERFKQKATAAAEENADYECAACRVGFHTARDACPECGADEIVRIESGDASEST